MPTPEMGLTFSPAASMDRTAGKPTDPNANVQEAIRTLSLRLPSIVGAKSIAPAALLSGQGSAGLMTPGQQSGAPLALQQILQQLFGAGGARTGMQGEAMPYVQFGRDNGTEVPLGSAPLSVAPPQQPRPMPTKLESDVRYNEF